ncbi:MAG: hypothetical protein Kow0063_13130 [Anaerolineae bacterium]
MTNDFAPESNDRPTPQPSDSLLARVAEISSVLHRQLSLDSLLQEIVDVVHGSLGFGAVVLNLIDEDREQVRVAACAGVDDEGRRLLEGAVYAWGSFAKLLQEQFRVGHCYFIPHDKFDWEGEFHGPVYTVSGDEAKGVDPGDRWHPNDALFVPIELGDGQIAGILSVDQPSDGRRPGPEMLQALGIFAQQAASAIQNAQLYEKAQREIAERKQAEEVLARERDLLQTLMDNIPDMILFKDAKSRFIRINRALAQLMNVADPREVVGKTDFDFWGADGQPFYDEEQRIIRTGQPIVDRVGQTPDLRTGELRWLSETKVPLRDETGQVVGLAGIARDITERVQAEEALVKERQLLQVLMDNVPDMIFFKDADSRIIRSNRAHAHYLGFDNPRELDGKTDFDLFSPEDARVFYEEEQEIIRTGQPIVDRIRQVPNLRTGEMRWLSETKVPLLDEVGKAIGLVGIARDITGRKAAEEALRASEERFAVAVRGSQDGVWDWDIKNNTLYWSPRLKELLGYADDEIEADFDLFNAMLHEDDKEHVQAAIEAHLRDGTTYDVEERLRTKSGEYRWFRARGQAIWDETGQPIRMAGSTTDITEAKQAQVERDRLLAALEHRSNQLQTAAVVSRAVTGILDPEELIRHVVDLVQKRFGLYYAGLFLVDQTGEWTGEPNKWAVLRAGTGKAGQQMVKAGHKLEIGGGSMIGWCVANAQARIALDVGEEAVRFENPWLPETRSEMALPLVVREKVIGAMTIQSTQEAAFSEEDVSVLQTMADQLAIAIENARLLAETQKALQEVQSVHQQYLRQEWRDFLSSRQEEGSLGYVLSRDGLRPAPQVWSPEMRMAIQERQPVVVTDAEEASLSSGDDGRDQDGADAGISARAALAAPITLRGQVIGALDVFDPTQPREWSDDDLALVDAVASQVALAVENARLFEQTQAALAETEALYRASQRITTSADLPSLYQVLVDELASRLAADQCQLTIFDLERGYGEVMAEYRPIPEADKTPIPLAGDPAYVILRDRREPLTIEDISTEPAFTHSRSIQNGKEVRSMLLIPILVRDELIGVVEASFMQRKRVFSETELDFCQTLANQAAITIANMRALEEQKETAERLREMDKLKTQFLANMSHELRTPLNSIIGFSRVILKGIDGPLTEMQETDLTAIYNSGQHLLGLINDILDLSKIEAGKMELNFDEVDLKPIIKGVMSSALGLVKDKPIELEQKVPEDLPKVWADSTRIRQVLLNLISNATKFTEEGKITLIADSDEEWVTISVTDTGVGIPEEKLESIFEEFTQVDGSTTRSVGGTGLGLPISRHFIEMHGGKITVESQIGVGSTFTITLPIHIEKEPVQELAEDQQGERASTAERHIVLSVDDDPGVISLYHRYLESEGYQVVGVTNSEEVLEKAIELQPFAITLDILMPAKDGWQVLRELKACPQTRHIPIIICSIVGNEGLGFSLGAADYLIKPIMENELLAALSRLDQQEREEIEVLVIDDQADDILLIRRMLEAQHRYRVIEADGGQTGIDLVRQHKPDLIILDLMMPEIDGFAVLEALKREPDTRSIPVIVITAKELTEQERQKLNGQVEVLLRKGLFTERELLEDLGKALDRIESAQSGS